MGRKINQKRGRPWGCFSVGLGRAHAKNGRTWIMSHAIVLIIGVAIGTVTTFVGLLFWAGATLSAPDEMHSDHEG